MSTGHANICNTPLSKLILFDCDGTLTDSHGAIIQAMQQAFSACALKAPDNEKVAKIIGLSLASAVEALCPDRQKHADICARYRDYYIDAEKSLRLYPGVIDTLATLQQRGYWMGIVTGKSKSGLLRVMKQFALNDYFYVFRTADCCHSKPHPAMAQECMSELGMMPEQTTLVGDAIFDMQMAKAANVRAFGVSFGVESASALYDAGACDVVDDFPALLEYFPPLNSHHDMSAISLRSLNRS